MSEPCRHRNSTPSGVDSLSPAYCEGRRVGRNGGSGGEMWSTGRVGKAADGRGGARLGCSTPSGVTRERKGEATQKGRLHKGRAEYERAEWEEGGLREARCGRGRRDAKGGLRDENKNGWAWEGKT